MNQKELWAETEKVWAAADRMWAKADAAFRAMPKPQQPADETTTFRLRGNRLRLFWRLFRAACIALATGKATLTLRSKPNAEVSHGCRERQPDTHSTPKQP